ncbi:MAG: type III-B CRISPR-associated protein Cas10/Cmr2 [Desulfobacterales bacterium]
MNQRNDAYWEQKIRFFLHDPVDKALKISGHEERAKKIAAAFGVSTPSKTEVSLADIIASGLDRANLPGYSSDTSKNGAVDFAKSPQITHPISGGKSLQFNGETDSASSTTDQIVDLINSDTNRLDRIWTKQEYFSYLFFALRKRLIANNCGQLGWLWDRLPADSRIPDHSIWNHSAMVSALGSAFADSQTKTAALMVFSISPVQSFINKTRKLRDHWAASVILSWLCFEGITVVIKQLGPDHIVYPSLQDQPLVEQYLEDVFHGLFEPNAQYETLQKDNAVASLPNKFVFIVPAGKEKEIAADIQERIQEKWHELAAIVLDLIGVQGKAAEKITHRQIDSWWRFNWSSANFVALDDQQEIQLLFEDKFSDLFATINQFSKSYPTANYAYPVTHHLIQAALAASKTRPTAARTPEPGIKCPVCGELEVLHDHDGPSHSAGYKKATDSFWEKIYNRFQDSTVREKERLCTVCCIKRFAPMAVKKSSHPLKKIFNSDKFPSTTEMATWEYRSRLKEAGFLDDPTIEQDLIDQLHEDPAQRSQTIKALIKKGEKYKVMSGEPDNYFAILMMDGDKMGDLVNGTNIAACWSDVLHPELAFRYQEGGLFEKKALWDEYLEKQRMLSPGLHAALSESLGAFSLHAVPRIIDSCSGRLIYAGGDDVAAVVPLSTGLDAAEKIRITYNTCFGTIAENGVAEETNSMDGTQPVFLLPGNGQGISISAALLICHHKQPLRGAMEEAHRLLDNQAKKKTGRDAFAIRLKKRSGQARDFTAKWQEPNLFADKSSVLESFKKVQAAYLEGLLSGSLIYRIPELETMVRTVLPTDNQISEKQKKQILQLFAYEIEHSGSLQNIYPGKKNQKIRLQIAEKLAVSIADITVCWDESAGKKGGWIFNGEASVIARYLAKGGNQQ